MGFGHLLRLADAGSFERGVDYAERGLVRILSTSRDEVTAVVRGSTEYDVALDDRGGDCTCPVGMRGEFCKHLVATVLTVEGRLLPAAETQPVMAPRAEDPAELTPVVDSLRVRGYLDWRRADRHGELAEEVADRLERSLTPETADELRPLLERGIDIMTRAILRSDDSSGIQSGALGRMLDLHAAAARLGSADPVKLARWMAKVGLAKDGFVDVDPTDYADALGERGLAAYIREVDRRSAADPDNYQVRRVRQRLAVQARDVPAIVETVGGELTGPQHFRAVVDALLEIDAVDEALAYALLGLDTRAIEHQTVPLFDTAVRLLTARGELEDALALRRRQLTTFPTAASYAALHRAAEPAGRWSSERLDALDVLLERNPRDYVVTLLREGEVDLAWGVSRTMSLDANLTHQLLQARAKNYPAEVFDDYVSLIDDTLKVADQQRYSQAVAYLRDLRQAAGAGLQRRYAELVDGLLETHKRRPKLVAMLMRLPAT